MVRRVIRLRWWLAAAGTLLAFGGSALASGLSSSDYRAEAVLVVGRGDAPLEPGRINAALTGSVARLLDSNLIAADVIANLRLRESTQALLRRVEARPVAPGLVRVGATDKTALAAEQIVQEITLVFPRLVSARFTGDRALRAKVWDPARVVGRTDRGWSESMGAAAAASAALCLLAWAPWRRARARLGRRRPAREPASNTVLQAEPAPETAAPARIPAAEPPSNTVLQAEARVAEAYTPANGTRGFNLGELESLVDAARERFPDRVDEWQAYVFYLRDHADIDGSLPENFRPLVEDVFADLLTTRR
jgi:hypothetical protein